MAGELRSTCRKCEGGGAEEADTAVAVLTAAEAKRSMQPCRFCGGTGASIGIDATIEDYLHYFDEPCTVTDEIFSLAQQIQQSQGLPRNRGEIELTRFANRRWIPENPGTYFEHSEYVAVLLPDGNFAIEHHRTAEFENPAVQIWHAVQEDTGWHYLPLHSMSDLFALFDFSTKLYFTTAGNTEVNFNSMPPGKEEAEFWKRHPWQITRRYKKGYGLLEKLREIYQSIQHGNAPRRFVVPDEYLPTPAKSPATGAPVKGNTPKDDSFHVKTKIINQMKISILKMIFVQSIPAGLLTFFGFICAYYAAHFFTHMWDIPWGSTEAIWFAASSAELFEYSLWTAGLWAIISAVFPKLLRGVPLMATVHAVQSGIAWPRVFLIPPLSPTPEWVSRVLEAVTVRVDEWLFFTSIFAALMSLILMVYATVLREMIRKYGPSLVWWTR